MVESVDTSDLKSDEANNFVPVQVWPRALNTNKTLQKQSFILGEHSREFDFMIKNILDFIKKHFDFKFYGVTYLALFTGLLIIPMLKFLPQKYGFENGLLENIQMTVLFVMVYLCASAKQHKNFFRFIILVLSILIIREVNCGRTLFFPRPNAYHQYYSWKELPWPWLGKIVHTVYGLWMGIVGLIFIKNKHYADVWNLVKNFKLPFWNLAFACFAMFMGAIAEKLTNNNFIFEEGFELLFYVSLLGFVWLYSRNKNYSSEEESEKEN